MHDHGSHPHHHPHSHEQAFRFGILLNVILVGAQIWASMRSQSVSLLADAWHNLGDVLGLVLAWVAIRLAARPTTDRFTYGLKSSTIWAALFNSGSLLFLTGGLLWESILRFNNPQEVNTSLVIPFAALGIVINGLSAVPFFKSKDLNLRGAFLHLVADALVSAGVLIGAFIQGKTHLTWIDPAAGIVICLVIAFSSIGILKEALSLSMYAVPKHLKLAEIKEKILAHPGVDQIHDLHVWGLGTSDLALTCHLLPKHDVPRMETLRSIEEMLDEEFEIEHVTIQIEEADSFPNCTQASHTQT
jgi:cobalt-zinc-cadmium efflux system protein